MEDLGNEDDLRRFIAGMVREDTQHGSGDTTWTVTEFRVPDGPWWYHGTPGFNDFNRELCPPGVMDTLPDGGVGIRSDDDFWTEAILPWRFRGLPVQVIVGVLWPGIEDPVFKPDTVTESRGEGED